MGGDGEGRGGPACPSPSVHPPFEVNQAGLPATRIP